MKAYLVTTGALFALIATAHFWRTYVERERLAVDPWFYLQGPGLGVVAGALSFWAWGLLWASSRSR
jgi:hypothetical protein